MNNVRLVCGGYSVDLPTDFGIQINKSIADIREPESRSSDWTKTFTLPGTKTNNKLFTHLFDLNLSIRNTTSTNFSPDFNPNLKADALLTVDEVTQIEGFIRLLSIKVNDLNQIEYECSMHGELADLFAKISDAKLEELDFTEYNHVLNATNIFNSWDTSIIKNSSGYVNFSGGAPIGEGYVYGWVDPGIYADYKKLDLNDVTPYIYAKTVVDKIFSGAGYTYSSGSFFNTAQFKRLVVPCPSRMPFLSETQIQNRQFEAEIPAASGTTYSSGQKILFTSEISDPSNQYDSATSIFTNDYSGQRYDFFLYTNASITNVDPNSDYSVSYFLYVNGIKLRTSQPIYKSTTSGTSFSIDNTVVFENIVLNSGDYVEIKFDDVYVFEAAVNKYVPISNTYTQNSGSKFYNGIVDGIYGLGDTMDFTGFFNGVETKQREFMRWLFTMFNLYIEATEIDKTLVVLPREEFLLNTVRDWTEKRDLSQPLEITPMGELEAGKYIFTYKEGDDDGNKNYKEDYARIYGDRQILVQNDFVKDEKKIEVGFVPTLIVKPQNELDKYLPEIQTASESTKSGNLRILQYKVKTCGNYYATEGKRRGTFVPPFTIETKYPFMGHLDDPLASTTDINFGLPRYIGLQSNTPVTNNNLYNAYWRKYINEITDKDSKLVKGSFYLTPADMEKLSFRDLYFFDGNYFRLNKIEDYDPINPSVNICEFLFLKTGPTFTATTGSVGGGGTQSSGGGGDAQETERDPIGSGNLPGKVIQNKGFSLGDFNAVGDAIVSGDAVTNYGRANAAFATSGTSFLPDSERSVVIGEGVQNVGADEVWLQGQLMTPNNFGTNRFAFPPNNYNIDLHDDIIISLGTGNHTLTLPDASTASHKLIWIVKKGAQGTLTIDAYADQLIDGVANYTINNHYGTACLVCDGTEWYALTNK
jgi:hypothetical protein